MTAAAERKCRRLIASLRKKHPAAEIILTGCISGKIPEAAASGVRIVAQPEKMRIADWIAGAHVAPEEPSISDFAGHSRAFVKVQDGCDNYCAYCVIPFMRGAPRSRPAAAVIAEIRRLAARGFQEIVLTGINLGAWGSDCVPRQSLSFLLARVAEAVRVPRLRLSSLEPDALSGELAGIIAGNRMFCRHLHIPLQSGDDEILGRMNRRYTLRDYLRRIEQARRRIPEVSFTTDVIVGFPGEEQRQFRNTLRAVEAAGFLRVHIFPFSPRPRTAAADMPRRVPAAEITARRQELAACAAAAGFRYRAGMENRNFLVLFETARQGTWSGYTDTYVPVRVRAAQALRNRLLPVRISTVSASATCGELLE
ncbi:MAG: MiaB/RimO family radical SAM methylthiotransferase [Candidatus Omnitrophica bacterium]|nr:MiaB/RimO family radical SAM methylthiotransferase [Candidatus Omnitrophota bacterium]